MGGVQPAQYEAVLRAVGAEWRTTREIANQTPWSVLTVIARLRILESRGRVEVKPAPKGSSPRLWRLKVAFTIGHEVSYDRDLLSSDVIAKERKVYKLGRRENYGGGWVWREQWEAEAFILANSNLDFPPKIYGVRLAGGWDLDVTSEPDSDGVHRLIVDSELFLLES